MRVFSVSRHFFKTNVAQSVAELILYSQKTQKGMYSKKSMGLFAGVL